MVKRASVDVEQHVQQLLVGRVELSGAHVLRVVAPVTVRTDPDLEQCRLVLLHQPVARCRERADPRPRPDEREAECQLHLPIPAGAFAVHEALPQGSRLALLHPRLELGSHVLHRRCRDLVGQAHPLDFLLRLKCTRAREERRGIDCLRESVEPGLREGGRLTHHPVRGLGAERKLEPDLLVGPGGLLNGLERARERRTGVVRVIPGYQDDVRRPGARGRIGGRRLDRDQHRRPLAGEDRGVVALHPPEVRQVENVVGRPDDERVQPFLGHQRLDAVELGVVARPGHQATRGGAGSPWASCQEITGLRSTPIFSISASITSPGFR